MKFRIGRNVRRFRANEKGAALTEFTFFLPIWITVFIGIINLGRVGIFATQVQLQAQQELWDQAIDVTAQYTSSADQMSPTLAAVFTGGEYGRLAGLSGNDQVGNDGIEVLAQVPLGAYGHFGESAEKSTIPLGPFVPEEVRMKYEASEVLDQSDQSRYPHKIVNDTLADQSYSGGIASILTSVIAGSGLVAAVGAGIRYGSVFADKDEQTSFIANRGTFRAGAHYDVLVPPRAVPSTESEAATFAISFLMFKLDDQYDEFQMFGKKNWDSSGTAPDTPSGDKDDFKDAADEEAQDDIDEECDGYCSANAGWDDDEENPQPKPEHWDKCGC